VQQEVHVIDKREKAHRKLGVLAQRHDRRHLILLAHRCPELDPLLVERGELSHDDLL